MSKRKQPLGLQAFREKLLRTVEASRWTYDALAKALGTTTAQVHRDLHGATQNEILLRDRLPRIAALVGMTPEGHFTASLGELEATYAQPPAADLLLTAARTQQLDRITELVRRIAEMPPADRHAVLTFLGV